MELRESSIGEDCGSAWNHTSNHAGCRRYFMVLILDKLGLYYFVNFVVLARLRRYTFINRVLRMLGI